MRSLLKKGFLSCLQVFRMFCCPVLASLSSHVLVEATCCAIGLLSMPFFSKTFKTSAWSSFCTPSHPMTPPTAPTLVLVPISFLLLASPTASAKDEQCI